jgi:hypothetical protein
VRIRQLRVGVGVVVVVVGIGAVRVLPASSGSDRYRPSAVAHVVALLHHDQQGIVLAHQAQAQSPSTPTRARAAALAASFRRQARALAAVLDAHDVPMRQRLVDTTRLEVADENAVGCDLMPDDALSRLAAAAPVDFDERFAELMDQHLVGGTRMSDSVLDGSGLSADQRAAVRRPQQALA